jgi:hypothetical protein
MDNIDLNIQNYDLNDLLNLFKIPFHFNEDHLKDAKKIVLKTHPDKSNLDKEYFLFFSQAYKYLFKIHQLRKASNTTNTEYEKDDLWSKEHTMLIDGKVKTMNQNEYHKWFNDSFEKMKIKDEYDESGYGNWLKSNEDLEAVEIKNQNEMNEFIKRKKSDLRQMVVKKDIEDINSSNHFNLIRGSPENYSSGMFDKLQFEDLKKAHNESVVPVTDEDFINRKKYTNIDELNRERTLMVNKESNFDKQEKIFNERKEKNDEIDIQRAYKLMNQDELSRQNYNKFWSNMKRINN